MPDFMAAWNVLDDKSNEMKNLSKELRQCADELERIKKAMRTESMFPFALYTNMSSQKIIF